MRPGPRILRSTSRAAATPGERAVEVASVRPHQDVLLVTLAGLHDRTAAVSLRGCEICIAREDLDAPGEGEYYVADLYGLTVRVDGDSPHGAGECLGIVAEVNDFGAGQLLLVRSGRHERMLPFTSDFIVAVDLDAREIRVRLPPGGIP